MMLQEIVFTALNGNPTISGLVSGRITGLPLPETTAFPAISFSHINTELVQALANPVSLRWGNVQIDVWDEDERNGLLVASGVKDQLASENTFRLTDEWSNYEAQDRIYRTFLSYSVSYSG